MEADPAPPLIIKYAPDRRAERLDIAKRVLGAIFTLDHAQLPYAEMAGTAVALADALLAELEKPGVAPEKPMEPDL